MHVDVIRNEWAPRRQVRVARLELKAGRVVVTGSPTGKTWRTKLLRPINDPDTGRVVSPRRDPEAFLTLLARILQDNDYVFAEGVHLTEHCEWDSSPVRAVWAESA
jgi:hypothetical protein